MTNKELVAIQENTILLIWSQQPHNKGRCSAARQELNRRGVALPPKRVHDPKRVYRARNGQLYVRATGAAVL